MIARPSASGQERPGWAARYHPALLLALVLLTNSAFDRWQHAVNTPAIDFFIAWSVPHSLAITPVNVYSPEGEHDLALTMEKAAGGPAVSAKQKRATAQAVGTDDKIDTPGSPFLYTVIGMFSSGDYDADQRDFALLCAGCFALSIVLLCRALRFSWLETVLALVVLASGYAPIVSDVIVGNLNQIQLLLITLFIVCLARSRPALAGLSAGLGVMLKPNLVIVAGLAVAAALIQQRYRRLAGLTAGMAAAIVAAVAISSAYFGTPGVWLDFFRNLPRLFTLAYPIERGNMGFSMLMFHLTGTHASAAILVAVVGGFLAMLWVTRPDARLRESREDALTEAFSVTAAGTAAILFGSNLTWLHYYVLLIPAGLYLIRPLDDAPTRFDMASRWTALIAFLLLSTSAGSLVRDDVAFAIVANSAAVGVFGVLSLDVWRRRSRAREWLDETKEILRARRKHRQDAPSRANNS